MSYASRRIAASLAGLASALVVAVVPPSVAVGDGAAVRVTTVTGSSHATDHGTDVSASFTVANRSARRQPAQTATIDLVAIGRDPGPERSYRIGTVPTPALAAGARRTVRARGAAPASTVAGRYHLRVCLSPRPGGPCTVSRGVVVRVGPAVLVADPGTVSFAEPETPAQEVLVTNDGRSRTNALVLELTGPDAADFTVDPGTCGRRLVPGASCTAEVGFAPGEGEATERTASLDVLGGGRGSTSVPLTGAADAPSGFSIDPDAYDYGDVVVGGAVVSRTFRLVNDNDTDAVLLGGNLDQGPGGEFFFDFVEGQNTCLTFTIPAHGSCTFSVGFAPSAAGEFTATAVFSTGEFVVTSALRGTGVMPPAGGTPSRTASHAGARSYGG